MSAARRTLLTATAAGTLMAALYFVPSANAAPDRVMTAANASADTSAVATPADADTAADTTTDTASATSGENSVSTGTDAATSSYGTASDGQRLADTGSVDTTPYLFGGTAFLGLGAGFVVYSVRRGRSTTT